MTRNVADALVETALRAGAERVYGVIGDSLNPEYPRAASPRKHSSNPERWRHRV